MIGAKVVACESNYKWGFVKGDTLEITDRGHGTVYRANNLTRPNFGGRRYVLISDSEFKFVSNPCEFIRDKGKRTVRIVKILGITVYKEVIGEDK